MSGWGRKINEKQGGQPGLSTVSSFALGKEGKNSGALGLLRNWEQAKLGVCMPDLLFLFLSFFRIAQCSLPTFSFPHAESWTFKKRTKLDQFDDLRQKKFHLIVSVFLSCSSGTSLCWYLRETHFLMLLNIRSALWTLGFKNWKTSLYREFYYLETEQNTVHI